MSVGRLTVIVMMTSSLSEENFYLSSGFTCPNFVCPSARDLRLPFSYTCPAKKMWVPSSGFLALEVPVSSEAKAGIKKKSHSDVC